MSGAAQAERSRPAPGGIPLTIRLILAAMLAGAAAWYALDFYQTRRLSEHYAAQFERRLETQAHRDRMRLDEQIRAQMALVRVLADHRPALNAIARLQPADAPEVGDGLPAWMPRRSALRVYTAPDLLLVASPRHEVRQVWNNTARPVPPSLAAGGARLFLQAEVDPLLTSFDGTPYMVMTAPVKDDSGAVRAWLLAASALDSDFLLRAQGQFTRPDQLVALMSSGERPAILGSTDTARLPPGAALAEVQERFLVAGKTFFDYGNSDLLASFATLIPRSEIDKAVRESLALERGHRTLMAALMSGCFLLALAYLTARLRRLAGAVALFRTRAFSVAAEATRHGDELVGLEQTFESLTEEVVASRAELDRQAREKMDLMLEQMRTRAEFERLRLLHSVTDYLGVGVIRMGEEGPVAANETMHRFIAECAPIDSFVEAKRRGGDAVLACRAGERIFAMVCPAGIEPGFMLVRDVTEERTAERALKRMNETLEKQVFERTRALQEEIDRHLETEAALIATKERAEIASRSKSEFLANVSHELRTPLNAIIGFSEVMIGEVFGPLGNQRYAGYARDIHFSGRHLLDVINDILDISKIEAGRMELCLETISMAEVAASAVRLARERLDGAGVSLVVDLASDLPPLRGDERRLKQALVNLLSNSAKFTADGGSVRLGVRAVEGRLRVEVADTGIGMTPQELALALQPFRQVDGGLARRQEGTGLGLPLARSFVELHGGTFRVESRKGAGTTVMIELPALPHKRGGPEGPPAAQSVLSGVA